MIERVGPVESASSVAIVDATVRRTDYIDEGRTGGISVTAADLDLLDTLRAEVAVGSWLDEASSTLPTIVLGNTAARRLGIDEPGVRVWLDDRWFSVIGILAPVELASELDSSAFVGIPLAEELFEYDGSPSTIYVRSEVEYIEDVRAVMGRTANPEDASEVEVTRPSDVLEAKAAAAVGLHRAVPGPRSRGAHRGRRGHRQRHAHVGAGATRRDRPATRARRHPPPHRAAVRQRGAGPGRRRRRARGAARCAGWRWPTPSPRPGCPSSRPSPWSVASRPLSPSAPSPASTRPCARRASPPPMRCAGPNEPANQPEARARLPANQR